MRKRKQPADDTKVRKKLKTGSDGGDAKPAKPKPKTKPKPKKPKPILTTICSSFKTILRDDGDGEKDRFCTFINELVVFVSRLRHEASIFANALLLKENQKDPSQWQVHLGDEKRWQQFYRACLKKTQAELSGKKEVENHENTQQHYQHFMAEPFDPVAKGQAYWEDAKTQFEINPEPFLRCDPKTPEKKRWEQKHFRKWLRHPYELESQTQIGEEVYREMKEDFEWTLADQKLRIRSSKFINAVAAVHDLKQAISRQDSKETGEVWWPFSSVLKGKHLSCLSSVIDIAAAEMATCALNSLTLNYEQRQLKTIQLDFPDVALASKIARLINARVSHMIQRMKTWKTNAVDAEGDTKRELELKENRRKVIAKLESAEVVEFIEAHRRKVRNNQQTHEDSTINEEFIETNSALILHYFHFLNTRRETERTKREEEFKTDNKDLKHGEHSRRLPKCQVFTLLPLHRNKRLFLHLQPKLILEISKKLGYPSTKDEVWDQWFDLSRIRAQPHLFFDRHIATDGVKASILYSTVPNRKKGKKKRTRPQFKSRGPKDEKADKPKTFAKRTLLTPSKGAHGLYKDSQSKLIRVQKDLATWQTAKDPFRLLQADPGRADLFNIQDSSDAKNHYRRMSKGEYYHLRKTTKFAKRREYHWKQFLEAHPEIKTDDACFRTTDFNVFLNSWISRLKVEDATWNEFYSLRMHGKWRLEMFKAQQRTDFAIVKRILANDFTTPTLVAYGNGKFPTSGPGHAATPVARIPKVLSKFTTVVLTDENNTSKVCPECGEKTLHKATLHSHVKKQGEKVRKTKIIKKTHTRVRANNGIGWTKIKLDAPVEKKVTRLIFEYELQKDRECFRILACDNKDCKVRLHRDHVACANIGQVCMEQLLHGAVSPAFRRKNADSG